MGNTVARSRRTQVTEAASLYAASGARKYLNRAERQRSLAGMQQLPDAERLFALTLAWTGARVSEVLALCPASFQIEAGVVGIVTLKRRKFSVREVPIPPGLMAELDAHFGLRAAQHEPPRMLDRLWKFCRTTAWRIIKRLMNGAGISGPIACPKAFRHAFGIGTLQSGIPLNLTQRWLGHSRPSTTAIYAEACGPEEIAFAARFWCTPSIVTEGFEEPIGASVY
jgi:integrase